MEYRPTVFSRLNDWFVVGIIFLILGRMAYLAYVGDTSAQAPTHEAPPTMASPPP